MKQHIYPIPTLFFLTVILAGIICFPVIWCRETQLYDSCGRFVRCGDIELGYPFWGLERPAYCGHSGFQLTCESDVLIFSQESLDYRVLEIHNSRKTITVARNDLWNTSCPPLIYNTTYNSMLSIDNVFGQETVSLYYGCNSSAPGLPLGSNYSFNCNANGTQRDGYFIRTSLLNPDVLMFLEQCNNHITVPVNQFTADQLSLATATMSDLQLALTSGFSLHWMVNNDECDRCGWANGRCGFNPTSPDLFACYCSDESVSLACGNIDESEGSKGALRMWQKVTIAFSCGTVGLMLLFMILFLKKRLLEARKTTNHQLETFIKNYGTLAPKRYTYSEIKKMTNSFKERLGQGGYGSVYKGQLPDGQLVAVKLLTEAIGDGEDFINEVASISRTSHVNIVTLLGFCIEGKKRALMYEFMPNGSLDKFLSCDGSPLNWNALFLITKGIARGLEYLHRGCNTRIVHFDIKPHNILLDEEFVPKISDFGMAKLCKRKESIVSVTGARGTVGYIAPEVFLRSLGGASHKSDVYSYGMMVLEMAGASKHNYETSASESYFPDQIYKQVETGDNLGFNGVTTKEEEELARMMVTVSLWCIQGDPSDRPSISKVVEMLEGSFESLQVPPRRFWSSSTGPAQITFPSATQSSSGERVLSV